jgi:hypothetical protein
MALPEYDYDFRLRRADEQAIVVAALTLYLERDVLTGGERKCAESILLKVGKKLSARKRQPDVPVALQLAEMERQLREAESYRDLATQRGGSVDTLERRVDEVFALAARAVEEMGRQERRANALLEALERLRCSHCGREMDASL